MEKAIYVITGVMASGKSTVAEALAHRLKKGIHLRGDIFRKMIVSGREEMCECPSKEALEQLDMRYKITAKVAREYYDYGFSVVVQDNYLGEKLNYFIRLLQPYPVYVIVLNPDISTITEREQRRGKKGYDGFTVESLHHMFLTETPKIGLWLDTTDLTVEETVSEIIKRAELEAGISDD